MTSYPDARWGNDTYELHGTTLPDPFRWLEDQDSDETRAWLAAQDDLFEQHLAEDPLRGRFQELVRADFAAGNVGFPQRCGPREFNFFRGPGREHFAVWVRDVGDTDWRCLVDPQELDPDDTTVLDGYTPSPDGGHVVVRLSSGGDEDSDLWVVDVDTGERVEPVIPRGRWSEIAWLPDSSGFYYTARPAPELLPAGEEQSHVRLWFHHLGTDPSTDVEVFGAGRPASDQHLVSLSEDGRHLVVVSTLPPSAPCDVFLKDLDADTPWQPISVGSGKEIRAAFAPDGRLYLHTTLDADRFRLLAVDPARPHRDHWTEVIPEHPTAVLRSYVVLDDHIAVTRDHDDEFRVTLHDRLTGDEVAEVPMPGAGYVGGPTRMDGATIGGTYGDFVRKASPWTFAVGDDEPTFADTTVTGTDVHVERMEYPSKDGTMVPMVLMWRGELDAPRPAVVFGYGGFGYTVTRPAFDHWGSAWTAAGGLYAIAGVRGGGEKGEAWHAAGSREHMQHTFDDFCAAAEFLVAKGWTTHAMVGATGSSNGATTVTASMVQRPDVFAAGVPIATGPEFAHSTRSDIDPMSEYGDPRVEEEWRWIEQWDPIVLMEKGVEYPAFLVGTFDGDARTPAFAGHKLVARLQALTGSSIEDAPVLLRHEEGTGHATRSVTRMVDLIADTLAFLARQLGLDPWSSIQRSW